MLKIIAPYLILIIFLSLLTNDASGQTTKPVVYSSASNRAVYANPWAGGMNACQFGKLDIDMDGVKDLLVFDRCGNRAMPFLAEGREDNAYYDFAPEFADNFPPLSDWAIFADYDGDGREDIFTYSPGFAGLKVYRNISAQHLEFELVVYPYLTSFQGGGQVNILVTYADYPAIADLDGDGDLDILSFYGLGSFVEMHKNMSVEKYGHRDSLDFIKTETCWGYFAESEESNEVTLDTCFGMEAWRHGGMGGSTFNSQPSTFNLQHINRHTGSTFCILDLQGDGLPDLLLGDVDYPNLVALYNGGDLDTARMTSYDWNYPGYDEPVKLFSMPLAFYEDVDRDDRKDLLVTPFDPNPLITDNFNSSWFYRGVGMGEAEEFHLEKKRFLQEDMIDVGAGAYPVLCDYDGDGLMDLFAGNHGRYDTSYFDQNLILHSEHSGMIALFRNTGSATQPAFELVTEDFAGLSDYKMNGMIATFGDLDGDSDPDMLLGKDDGQIAFFENEAVSGGPMLMQLREMNYQGIDVGNASAPVLFDLDADGLEDLVIGEKGGNLNYYRNSGTLSNPQFGFVTDSLGKVNVTDYDVSLSGCSVPFLVRDGSGHVQLLVGSEQGKIFYFPDIEGDLNGKFKESDGLPALIGVPGLLADRGYRTAPALADLNGDGTFDLIAGNFSGGLEYFSREGPPAVNSTGELPDSGRLIEIYPNPAEDFMFVETADPGRYAINSLALSDMTGRILPLAADAGGPQFILNLSGYSQGIYFLRIEFQDLNSGRTLFILKKVLKKTKSK